MARPYPFRTLLILLTASVVACASGGASAGSSAPGSNRNVITSSELQAAGNESAYDVIQRLRPEYLRVRPAQGGSFNTGVGDAPPPEVVVNGQRVGELADLRHIAASRLAEIRYYDIEAGKRKFGMQYIGGVIELVYR